LNNYNLGDLKTWYTLCLRIIIIIICGLNYFNYSNSFQKNIRLTYIGVTLGVTLGVGTGATTGATMPLGNGR
jgi:hypothetical protein